MKRGIITILQAIFICLMGNAQYIENSMTVKSMNGKSKPLSSYIDQTEGHVTLFVFWKTCCPTNLNMIDSLLELTDENGFSNDITVILVSVDDNRSTDRVMPVVKTKGWEADVILDVNRDIQKIVN